MEFVELWELNTESAGDRILSPTWSMRSVLELGPGNGATGWRLVPIPTALVGLLDPTLSVLWRPERRGWGKIKKKKRETSSDIYFKWW